MRQQIEECLKNTIGKYYSFEQDEIEDVVEKMYDIFHANKQEENPEITKKRTSFSITTLNTMNKNDLKNICTNYGIVTGNLKKNDLILLIVDYQRHIINKEEHDSDISSITDDEKDNNSIDTSVTQTSLKSEPVPVVDGEDVDLDDIIVIENDIDDIGFTSKEKRAVLEEVCSRNKSSIVVGYDITPNQSDLDSYLEKQFEIGYLRKYNNIFYDRKLKRYMILEENEYVHLNIKRFTKQILKIMINSNIEYCEDSENEDIQKYAKVFESVLSKHRVYSATSKNLQKNIEYLIKHISK